MQAAFAVTYSLDNDFSMTGKMPLSLILGTKINVETATPLILGYPGTYFF